jgi:hypothetical protein
VAEPDQAAVADQPAVRRLAGWVTLTAVVVTFWELTYPLKFRAVALGPWLAVQPPRKIDTVGNVVLFLPGTIGAGWLARLWGWKRGPTVAVVTLAGAVLSFTVETMQVWLPERDSSINDLVANTLGAALGAALGFYLAPRLTAAVTRWRAGLRTRVWARRLLWALLLMALLRWAPGDLAPQVDELKRGWHRTVAAGGPLHATRLWVQDGRGGDGWAAAWELAGAAVAAVVAGLVAFLTARALREDWEPRGERSSPAPFVLLGAAALVIGMELATLAVRSRTMNATDLCAGLAGVAVGVAVDALRGSGRAGDRPRR